MLQFGHQFSSFIEIVIYYIEIQINKLYKRTQSYKIVMHWKLMRNQCEINAVLITGYLVSLGSILTGTFWST